MHMLVRHKVADFAKWKPVYDAHASARQNAGLRELHLLRNTEDSNEVILLFSVYLKSAKQVVKVKIRIKLTAQNLLIEHPRIGKL